MTKPTCVITGISSGIGLKVAEIFSQKGADVLGISRRATSNAQCVKYFSADLTDSSQLEGVAKSILDTTRKVDYLIHCAGVMPTQPAHALKWEDKDSIIVEYRSTNIFNLNAHKTSSKSQRLRNFCK